MSFKQDRSFYNKLSGKINAGYSPGGGVIPSVNSLSMDGVDAHVNYGDVINIDHTDSFTFSVWLKLTSPASGYRIISKIENNQPNVGYEILVSGTVILALLVNNFTGGANVINRKGTDTVPTASWFNFIWTYDGSDTAAGTKWYFNNVEESGYVTTTDTLSGTTVNTEPLTLGSRSTHTGFLDGNIDQFSYWPSVVSSGVRAEIYNGGTSHDLSLISLPPANYCPIEASVGDDATSGTGVITDVIGSLDGTPINTIVGDLVTDVA